MKHFSKPFSLISLTCFAVFSLQGDSGAWSITAPNVMWDDNANWTGAAFPNNAGEAAGFIGAPGTSTIDSSQDITVGSINFDVPGNSISIGFISNSLTLDNGSDAAGIHGAGAQTHFVDTPIVLQSDLSINVGPVGSIYFTKPISGNHSVKINVDSNTHINWQAAHTYTGDTIVYSGFLDLTGPGSTVNIPGSITILGSGAVSHDPTVSNNYDADSEMTVVGGSVFLRGTTQTLNNLTLIQGAMVQGPEASTLVLTENTVTPAILIGSGAVIAADVIELPNGGFIRNDMSLPGASFFRGDFTFTGFTTLDLNGNPNVELNIDNNPLEQITPFNVGFYNVKFVNGSIDKVGAGIVLIEGNQSEVPDFNILNGVVKIGRGDSTPFPLATTGTITIADGARLSGFSTIGISGSADVVNESGSLVPGDIFTPGTLTISGDYEQQALGSLYIQGFNSSTVNTLIVEDGTVSLDGAVHFFAAPDSSFNVGDQLVLVDNSGGAITGMFSAFTATLPAGLSASLTYTSTQVIMNIEECCDVYCLLSPTNLQVTTRVTSCAAQQDFVHRLSWMASSSNDIVAYKVYVDGQLVATINALNPLTFDHHYNPALALTYEYAVTAVNTSGAESAPVVQTV